MNVMKNSGTSSVLEKAFTTLTDIKKRFGGLASEAGALRPEPVAIGFFWPTGVAKTSAVDFLAKGIFASLPKKEPVASDYLPIENQKKSRNSVGNDYSDAIYYRNLDTEFFDGYKSQPIMVYDEFGQMIDVAGQASVYSEFINCKNATPMRLHMAELSDKANSFFKSDYIITTSNVVDIKPNGIYDASAVKRRFDFYCIITVKKDFCLPEQQHNDPWGRSIDFEGLSKNGKFEITQDMFELHLMKLGSDRRTLEKVTILTMDQLLDLVIKKRQFYDDVFKSNTASSELFASKAQKLRVKFNLTEPALPKYKFEFGIPDGYEDFTEFISYIIHKEGGSVSFSVKGFIDECVEIYQEPFLNDVVEGKNFDLWYHTSRCLLPKIIQKKSCIKELIDEVQPFENVRNGVLKFLSDNKLSLTIVTALSIALGLRNSFKTTAPGELQSPSIVKPKVGSAIKSLTQLKDSYSSLQMGAAEDPNGDLLSDSIGRRNCYAMFIDGEQQGQILFFKSTLAIMPKHFLTFIHMWVTSDEYTLNIDSLITFKCGMELSKDYNHFTCSIGEIMHNIVYVDDMESSELAIVRMPERIGAKPDIVKNFKNRSEFKEQYNHVCLKMLFHKSGSITVDQQRGIAYKVDNHSIHDIDNSLTTIPVSYHVNFNTSKGHCGAIMFDMNRKVTNKIIGMHFSGSPSLRLAVSAPIYKEWLDKAVCIANKASLLFSDKLMDSIHDHTGTIGKELITSYEMGKTLKNWPYMGDGIPNAQVSRSNWVPSKMMGVFQQKTMAPAVLHPIVRNGVRLDPKMIALQGYGLMAGYHVNEDLLAAAIKSEVDYFNSVTVEYVDPKTWTIEEAITGLKDDIDSGPLSRKSSPGYGYISVRKGLSGKKLWFGDEMEINFDLKPFQILKEELNNHIVDLQQGILPTFVFVTNLKDELRPLHKLVGAESRNFSSSPMSLTLLCKMYFGSFLVSQNKNRCLNSNTIGINPYGPEWDLIARMLLAQNKHINAGDFKGFDKRHIPQISLALYGIVEDFYRDQSPEDAIVRKTLWPTIFSTYQLV
jgi:hypothetical protein